MHQLPEDDQDRHGRRAEGWFKWLEWVTLSAVPLVVAVLTHNAATVGWVEWFIYGLASVIAVWSWVVLAVYTQSKLFAGELFTFFGIRAPKPLRLLCGVVLFFVYAAIGCIVAFATSDVVRNWQPASVTVPAATPPVAGP